jgi:integrase
MRRLLRDYVLVLAHSGLRIGEANDLCWRDVETFRDGRGRRNVRLHVRGKTGKRVVIPRVAAARHLARLRGWTAHAGEDDLVFAMPDGRRIGTLATPFNKVLARAALTTNSAGEKFTLYSLRHFYAVQTIAKDIDIFMIARNMGTSVAMIEQHYGRGATPQSRADRLGG